MISYLKVLSAKNEVQRIFIRTKALAYSPNARINKNVIDRYMCLPLPDCLSLVNYIWIDGRGDNLRARTRTLDFVPTSHKEVPTWTVNGNSTYFTGRENSDVYICPVAMYNDPIRRGNNKIVLCETYMPDHKPTKTNKRRQCIENLNKMCEEEPIFGLQQKFHLMDIDDRPFGWPIIRGEPRPTDKYYCGVGAKNTYGRDVLEAHYRACLYAGIPVAGAQSECNLSQWKIKVGPTKGIKAGDDLWTARYLLHRVAEEFGIVISFHPKILKNWCGSGVHVTFSTKKMRADNGIKEIEEAMCKLEKAHEDYLTVCDPFGGMYTKRRLEGHHLPSDYKKFTYGVGSRGTSIRIPKLVAESKKGYFEDRRPSANCDPYSIIGHLVKTLAEC